MFVSRATDAVPRSPFDGVTHRVLIQPSDVADLAATVLWTEVQPGHVEPLHHHPWEQVYVVLAGRGRVSVAGEQRELGAGDLVHIPGGAEHGIDNIGDEVLRYLSSSVPAWEFPDLDTLEPTASDHR